ncbi:MAG: hypothetical protein FWD54_07065 [Endomicrobia bacterium]|nr:hypothetical protein [Endomicrobiia bacterium]MCL2800013.1 hypothetical protein [Endomicrobiia bacterium]
MWFLTQEVNKAVKERKYGLAMLGYFTGMVSFIIYNPRPETGFSGFITIAVLCTLFTVVGSFLLAYSVKLLFKISAAELFILIGLSWFMKSLLIAITLNHAAINQLPTISSKWIMLLQIIFVLLMTYKAHKRIIAAIFAALLLLPLEFYMRIFYFISSSIIIAL